MEILADARALVETFDGISRYSLNMLRSIGELRPDWSLSVFIQRGSAFHLDDLEVLRIIEATPRFSLTERTRLTPLIDTLRPDVYLNFSMAGPCPSVPSVVTVHDLMVLNLPDYFGSSSFRNYLSRKLFRMLIRRSVSRASMVSVPSDATRRELQAEFGTPDEEIVVTGEGQNLFDCREDRAGERKDFLLYVGNARAYKNIPRILSAWSRLRSEDRGTPPLVMVVRKDRAWNAFMSELDKVDSESGIEVLSHVPDGKLRELYSTCRALVMPSIQEGFGLPALEAMAAGTPVLASSGTALEELVGDTGVLVDPHSVDSITEGMRRISSPGFTSDELTRRTISRACEHTWLDAARILVDGLERIVCG
jgi:glycosyltransferase involved in cell wall biosynthesis